MTESPSYRWPLAEFARVASAKTAALASLFLTGVLVARATGPSGFGYYSAGLSLILLMDAIIGQPIDNSLVRFGSLHSDRPREIEQVQGLVFRTKLLFGLLLLLLARFSYLEFGSPIFGNDAPPALILVVVASGLALLVTRSLSCSFQVQQRFDAYARLDLTLALLRVALVLLLFVSGQQSPLAYLGVYAASGLVAFAIFQYFIPQPFVLAPRPPWDDTKRMLSYAGATSAIVLFGTVSGRADIPVLIALTSADEAGHYSAAMQIAYLGMLLASYVAVIFQPKVVELGRKGLLGGVIRINTYAAAAAAVFYAPIAFGLFPVVLPWIFGAGFVASVPILQILLLGILADLLIVPVLLPYAMQVLARQALVCEALILLAFFAAIAVAPGMSAIYMAWLVTAVRFAKLAAYFLVVVRHLSAAKQVMPAAEGSA